MTFVSRLPSVNIIDKSFASSFNFALKNTLNETEDKIVAVTSDKKF